MIEGVDFSFGRPSGDSLVAAGKAFVIRYVPYSGDGGKGLTAAEVADYQSHGLAVCLVWESTNARALSGRSAGALDATIAKANAAALGFPVDLPIYFACDFDMRREDEATVAAYFAGAAGVIGLGRTGIYGGLSAVQHAQAGKWASWFWQTYAWSGGIWASGIQLQQYSNGHSIGGAAVDYDRALVAEYGGWKVGSMPTTSPVPDGPATYLVDIAAGGTAYYDLASSQVANPSPMTAIAGAITYGTGKRGDGKAMRAFAHPSGFVAWVGADKCTNVRPKTAPPPAGTVTVTGQGLSVRQT